MNARAGFDPATTCLKGKLGLLLGIWPFEGRHTPPFFGDRDESIFSSYYPVTSLSQSFVSPMDQPARLVDIDTGICYAEAIL